MDRDKYCKKCGAGPYTEAELSYIIGHGYLCDSCLTDLRNNQ